MKTNSKKTKQQLLDELTQLHQRLSELEARETKYWQTEEALAQERNLLHILINNVPDHIYVKDTDSRFVLVNQAVVRHLGAASPDDVIGKNDFDFSPPDLAAGYYADEVNLFQTGQPLINQEQTIVDHYTNTRRLVLSIKIPVHNQQGHIAGLVGINRDITELVEARQALEQSKLQIQNILESITDAFFAVDKDWKFTYVNRRAEQLLRRSREDLLGQSLWQEFPGANDSKFFEEYQRAMTNRTTVEFETYYEPLPGWIRVHVYPYSDGLSVYFRNITARKRAEATLAQRAAQLALINDIGRKVAAVLELDNLLQQAAILVQQRFNYHHVALFLLDQDRARLKAIAGSYQTYFPPNHTQLLTQGIIGWVATHGEKVLANDVTLDPRYISLIPDQTVTRAELCLPIKIAGQTVGVLDIQTPHLNSFSENDILAMETLTDQIAVAIENARLYQAVQQELVERKQAEEALRRSQQQVLDLLDHLEDLVDERTAELKRTNQQLLQTQESLQRYADRLRILQQIDRAILSAQSPEAIAQAGLYHLQRLLPCQQASVIGFDADTGQASILAAYTGSRLKIKTGSPPVPGQINQIVEAHESVTPLLDWPLTFSDAPIEGGCTYINVPLIARGQLIGSLNLGAAPQVTFTSEHTDIAAEVADPLALAVHQARLYQQVQHYAAQLEQRVAERTAKLEEINAELKSFTFSVSHDLRAPLRAVQGFASALLEDCAAQLDPLALDYAQRINSAAERMDTLVQELLVYSRLSRADLRLQPVDLANLMADVLTQLEVSLSEQQAQIVVEQPLSQVIAHYSTLAQVLSNLITNAVKFVKPGQPPLVRIWTQTLNSEDEPGAWVRLWVEDNGIGIAPENQAQIFQIFERLHGIEAYPGSGIGLAMVRKGINRMGGQVGVESELGRGSRFWIELPKAI